MKSSFDDFISACKYLFDKYINSLEMTIKVRDINFLCDVYKKSNVVCNNNNDVKNIFSLCKNNDCATQILLCNNLTINSGVTFTPPYRCKGVIIYCRNVLVNNGNVSMTARGASATGQNIYLVDNEFVPAIGASGGASVGNGQGLYKNANPGSNGTNRKTGGGASGCCNANGGYYTRGGKGGDGTSFSGGPSGGSGQHSSATDGSNTGGAAGIGGKTPNDSNWSTSGTGNPGAAGGSYCQAGLDGTGGLLIIFSNIITGSGQFQANGTKGQNGKNNYANGSGSGGGSLNIFYCNNQSNCTYHADGGAAGTGGSNNGRSAAAKGGNGSVTLTEVSSKYFLIDEMKINSNIYDNSYSVQTFDYESFSSVLGE